MEGISSNPIHKKYERYTSEEERHEAKKRTDDELLL